MSRDRGSATIWLAGFAALIVLVTVAAMVRGNAVVARHRAATAADLAALAAAVKALDGEAVACAGAEAVATRNGASLIRCAVSGEDVEVEVARALAIGGLGAWVATARARAGPADRPEVPTREGVGGPGAPPNLTLSCQPLRGPESVGTRFSRRGRTDRPDWLSAGAVSAAGVAAGSVR